MAASAWRVYNEAKKYLQTGDIDLNTAVLKIGIFKASSNASTYTLSTGASITVAASHGIKTQAKTLSSVTVTAGASAKVIRFDAADVVFTASTASAFSALYAVIYASGGKAIAWCKMSTSGFSVTASNTLTIAFNASGIWELSGGST
jgi:hypothetical protein